MVFIMKKNQKQGKIISGFLRIYIILISLIFLVACESSPYIIPRNSTVFYTKNELIDLYWEHDDELDEVAEIVLASKTLRQRIIDQKNDWDIRFESDKRDFADDDWERIVYLFKEIRPLMIVRSLQGGDVVYIDFGQRKVNGCWVSNTMFYFKNAETAESYSRYTWVGKLEHIDGYWYVSERIDDR